MPKENSDGYDKSSVLSYVEGIPDEPNRLLIFHGMIGMCYLSRIRFSKKRVFDLKPEVGSFFSVIGSLNGLNQKSKCRKQKKALTFFVGNICDF